MYIQWKEGEVEGERERERERGGKAERERESESESEVLMYSHMVQTIIAINFVINIVESELHATSLEATSGVMPHVSCTHVYIWHAYMYLCMYACTHTDSHIIRMCI